MLLRMGTAEGLWLLPPGPAPTSPFWAACPPQDGRAAVPPTAALPILGRRLWAAAIVANYCQRALVHLAVLAVFADALRCVLVRT